MKISERLQVVMAVSEKMIGELGDDFLKHHNECVEKYSDEAHREAFELFKIAVKVGIVEQSEVDWFKMIYGTEGCRKYKKLSLLHQVFFVQFVVFLFDKLKQRSDEDNVARKLAEALGAKVINLEIDGKSDIDKLLKKIQKAIDDEEAKDDGKQRIY